MAPSFEIVRIGSAEDLRRHTQSWCGFLDGSGVEAGIFCDPRFIEKVMDFAGGSSLVVAVGLDNGQMCCLLPFQVRHQRQTLQAGPWKVPFLKARVLSLPDFEFAVRAGHDRFEVLNDAIAQLRRTKDADLVVVDNAPTRDSTAPANGQPGWTFRNRQTTYLVHLPQTFAAYWTSLSSGVRRAFERRKKGLNQKCRDGVRLRRFTQKEEMGELHPSLTAVWQKSWHAKFGMYEPPPIACLEGLAAQGWMRSYVLMADSSPVAYQLGYQYRETYFCDSIGFDAEWRDYSPGKLLSHLLIEDLFGERTPRTLDFGFGYNDYKRDLGNHAEERAQASLALTARGRVVLSGVDACDRLGATARDLSRRFGIYKRLRDWLHQVDAPSGKDPGGAKGGE